jgi:16S rRNA (cytosine967-C5)-methyltransferase
MGMTPPGDSRAVAIGLLKEVLDRRRPLDDALAASDGFSRLDARDRAAARMLAATVLRRRGQIEGLIDDCLDHPLPYSARPVRHYLRLGVAQLLFLDVPDHAALNTTVALARAAGHDRYTGLVNAVLRRLSRDGKTMAAKQDAARLNTPDWLWQSWQATYGETVARDIAAAHLGEPPLDLSIRADARGRAGELDAEALPTGTLRRWAGGRVADLPGYADGWWWVQDAAAALPARLLSDIAGRRVIDLCAAPGGKTAQLAAAGANVVAVDKSPRRLDLLGANMKRLGLEAERVIGDATSWRPAQPADAVLLDAPCTATGTIRRHPEIPWLKSAEDVAAMAGIQDALLDAAVEMVRPGGLLVYCTCSLQPEEGRDRIAALQARGAPVAPVPVRRAEVSGLAELIAGGCLRTLPSHLATVGGMDGFFAARLRRE